MTTVMTGKPNVRDLRWPCAGRWAGALVSVCLALPVCVCAAEPEFWLGWTAGRLAVGNERDGFRDAGPLRQRRTDPAAADYCGLPYLAKVPDEPGKWMLMFRAKGGVGGGARVVVQESRDECETWQTYPDVREVGQEPPMNASATGFQCLGNGVLLCHGGNVRSADGGHTWRQLHSERDERFAEQVIGDWDPPLVLKGSGGTRVLATGYARRLTTLTHLSCQPLMRESSDAGLTWTPWRGVPEFFEACEVALAYNAKGEIVAGIREDSSTDNRDDEASRLSVSISRDEGKTWTPPKVVAGAGRHHPSFAVLPDGRLVLTYVVREGYPMVDGKRAYGVEAIVSEDDGRTWDVRHRYVLARWEDDCLRTGADGRKRPIWGYMPAPQCTSTQYLPASGQLVTAFGRNNDPACITMVKWRPLAKGAFAGEAPSVPPSPIPAARALALLRTKAQWFAEYDAAKGLPAGGWLLNYPSPCAVAKEGWLNLDHRDHFDSWCAALCGNQLERLTGALVARMRLKIPVCPDGGRTHRFNFFVSYGTGPDRGCLHFHLDKNADIVTGTLGAVALPARPGEAFLLEIWMDRASRTVRAWVDGRLVADKPYEPTALPAERQSECHFGAWSSAIGGVVQVGELDVGGLD